VHQLVTSRLNTFRRDVMQYTIPSCLKHQNFSFAFHFIMSMLKGYFTWWQVYQWSCKGHSLAAIKFTRFFVYSSDFKPVCRTETCSRICDEWTILVQCSSFSIVRHWRWPFRAKTCVESESVRMNNLLHCWWTV
jgi:hypothetical protein